MHSATTRLLLVLLCVARLLWAVPNAYGQRRDYGGVVLDAKSHLPLIQAHVQVLSPKKHVFTDIQGRYSFSLMGTNGCPVTISYLGYRPSSTILYPNRPDTILLQESSFAMKEVTVVGEFSPKEPGTTTVNSTALQYLQPTSLSDVLSLTPGGLIRKPSLGMVQQVSMRETRSSANTALGTSIVVDGAPVSNDANLQQLGNRDAMHRARSTMNRGLDLRAISVDHIQKIEIIQGIPSVRYGNLSSGALILTTKMGQSPWTIRVQADPYTKLTSVGKGFSFKGCHSIYSGLDYTHFSGNLNNPIETYNRYTGTMKYSYSRSNGWKPFLACTYSYTGTLNRRKFDPEVMTSKEVYRDNYNRFALSLQYSLAPDCQWLSGLEGTLSVSYTHDFTHQERYILPLAGLVQPRLKTTGEAEGFYLPNSYFCVFDTDGKPFSLFLQQRSSHGFSLPWLSTSLLTGLEFRFEKNFGEGTIYDPLLPPMPQSSLASRPVAYRDIPAEAPLGAFLEPDFTVPLWAGWDINLRTGVRATYDLSLMGTKYEIGRRVLIEPRVQFSLNSTKWELLDLPLKGSLFVGYGEHLKMPTLGYLYPEKSYNDRVLANYAPPEESERFVWVRTVVLERRNYSLLPNREKKKELGLQVSWGRFSLMLSAFEHETLQGFSERVYVVYAPYDRYETHYIGGGKPSLSDFSSKRKNATLPYPKPANSIHELKRGIEYSLRLRRIPYISTNIAIQGAYYRTLYGNSLPRAYRPESNGGTEAYPYIGYYMGRAETDTERFHTLLRADTHIPAIAMMFTTTIQAIWSVWHRQLPYSGRPAYWYDQFGKRRLTADLNPDNRIDARLLLHPHSELFATWREPVSINLNLKVTKEIGKHVRISFYVMDLMSYSPIYQSNLKTYHQKRTTPYFGSELRFSF